MARPATVAALGAPLTRHEQLARVFRTLGDERRLRILELLLAEGELGQSELVKRLDIPQSRVSEHLRCLTWCGLVSAGARQGRPRYRIADARVGVFIRMAREFLDDNEAAISTCRIVEA